MKTSVEKLEGNHVKLTVTIPAADVDQAVSKAYADVSGKIRVPGFRKGRAPRPIIDSHVGKERVLADATEQLVEDSYPKAIDAEDLRPIDQPEIGELTPVTEGEDYTYSADVELKPEYDLTGDWQHLKVVVPPKAPSEADVDNQIETMRERFASLEPVEDRGVEMGDFVLLSFVGLIEGEPYDGNTVDKYLYETGRGQMPKEFDDALIAAKPGDKVTATFTIPDTSTVADYIGKTATFEIEVHEIKKKQLPELDEEFAGNAGGYDTMDEMRADVREKLEQQRAYEYNQVFEREAQRALAEHLDGEAPEPMVMQRRDNMIRDFFNNLEERGITLKDYVSAVGVDPEQIQKDIEEEARARVKQDLALESLFRAEGMEVTDADIDADIEDMAKTSDKTPEELRRAWEEAGVLAVVSEQIARRKAIQWLFDHVEVEEKQPEPAGEQGTAEEAKPKKTRKSAKKKEEG